MSRTLNSVLQAVLSKQSLNRPKNQPIFWSIRAKTSDCPKFFGLFWSIKGATVRDKRQHRNAISPLNDTCATLSRQFGDIVAWVSHWGYRDKSHFPSFAWRTKKPRLRNSFTASEALSAKRGNGTCPYIPAWSISQQLSVLPWDPPPADSTSPCAAAWDRWGRTAQSALGAPSGNAGSRSDSR